MPSTMCGGVLTTCPIILLGPKYNHRTSQAYTRGPTVSTQILQLYYPNILPYFFFDNDILRKQNSTAGGRCVWAIHMQQHEPQVAKVSALFYVRGEKEQIKRQLHFCMLLIDPMHIYFIKQLVGDRHIQQQILSGWYAVADPGFEVKEGGGTFLGFHIAPPLRRFP